MYMVWGIVGAIVGAYLGEGVAGGVAGLAVGVLWERTSQLRRDLDDALRRLDAATSPVADTSRPVRSDWPEADTSASPAMPVPLPMPVQPRSTSSEPVPPMHLGHAPSVAVAAPTPVRDTVLPRHPETIPVEPVGPSLIERAVEAVKRWFTEGNVPVKVGMLVLFAGIAAFLKYASDVGLLRVPMPVRLALVALVAIAGTAFGWKQRETRRGFALSLQGGAIGVLVMTVFAAYRLYGLIGSLPTFALLVVFVVSLGVLAVVQDALALAVLGLVAGFAAPIIVSSGQGDHVALFAYYAVLNLGILGIAWKRAWRVLNVLGFVATFGVGTAWGVLRYEPGLFASTEPFLVLHFLLYLAVPWLHVLRSLQRNRAILDGSLMFGNPIVCMGLQTALLDGQPMALAVSALVASTIYVGIAFALRRRDDMRLLRDTWAVLAVAFATLAVPLALSVSVTAAVFALEGAGLIWLGFRQSRRLPRWTGVFLQLAAACAWLWAAISSHAPTTPFLNGPFVGAMLIVVGAAVGAWQFDRHGRSQGVSSLARVGLALWALAWWFLGFMIEVDRFVLDAAAQCACWIALVGITAWPVAEAFRRTRKLDLGRVLAFVVPVLFVLGIVALAKTRALQVQAATGLPLVAVIMAGVAGWFALRAVANHRVAAVATSVAWWARWLTAAAVATDVAWGDAPSVGQGWVAASFVLPTLLLMAGMLWWPRPLVAPLAMHASVIRRTLGGLLLAGTGLLGLLLAGTAGNPLPLPFVPVLNPVDLLLIAVLVLLFRALSDADTPATMRAMRSVSLAAGFFVAATSATLRAVHYVGDVPWNDTMMVSSLAQLSLTVVWSVIGVLAWVLGSRRGQRMLWMAGAAIMGVVLAKLLLVDRDHLGNLFGIGSFMAYGLLCTLIGYLAPAPPRHASLPPESPHA